MDIYLGRWFDRDKKGGAGVIDFASVHGLAIPEGDVVQITALDGTVLWKRAGLPAAYQQVEYIQSDGNGYFDTGVLASDYPDGIKYVFRGNVTSYQTTSAIYWFGALANGCRSGNVASGSVLLYVLIGGGGDYSDYITKPTAGQDFEFVFQGTPKAAHDIVASLNGTQLTKGNAAMKNSEQPATNIYFLTAKGTSAATTANRKYYGKVYSFTMDSANGTPIRNFVPCYRKSDGVIGLYDTVTDAFFTNIGTGNFTKGANV